jgi:radical SAM protein with 4Fe4S-binding SPASM domain
MTLADVSELIGKLKAEGKDVLALLGGEPSEHPQFDAILGAAHLAQIKVRVFSNGDIPSRALDALCGLSVDECQVILNANACGLLGSGVSKHVEHVLQALQSRASLGVTMTNTPFDHAALLRHYARFGLRPRLRLGLAHPRLDDVSPYVIDYRAFGLATRLVDLALQAHQLGLTLDYDCGFVACMFSREQRQALEKRGIFPHCVCNPIPDIAAEKQAWPCFALSSRYRVSARAGQSLAELKAAMSQRLEVFSSVGLYTECQDCPHKTDQTCRGGCVARIINTFEGLAS